jgi:hypothetical protein
MRRAGADEVRAIVKERKNREDSQYINRGPGPKSRTTITGATPTFVSPRFPPSVADLILRKIQNLRDLGNQRKRELPPRNHERVMFSEDLAIHGGALVLATDLPHRNWRVRPASRAARCPYTRGVNQTCTFIPPVAGMAGICTSGEVRCQCACILMGVLWELP